MIRIAVAGYGYWGLKLARNIAEARECELAALCDPTMERLVHLRALMAFLKEMVAT